MSGLQLIAQNNLFADVASQQSVHLTLGSLRQFQAVSYALSFFWLDGFAVPAPAQVTQTVRRVLLTHIKKIRVTLHE
jgi:hypothetical protein